MIFPDLYFIIKPLKGLKEQLKTYSKAQDNCNKIKAKLDPVYQKYQESVHQGNNLIEYTELFEDSFTTVEQGHGKYTGLVEKFKKLQEELIELKNVYKANESQLHQRSQLVKTMREEFNQNLSKFQNNQKEVQAQTRGLEESLKSLKSEVDKSVNSREIVKILLEGKTARAKSKNRSLEARIAAVTQENTEIMQICEGLMEKLESSGVKNEM
jgi:chromosome segregation ATPase